MYAYTSYDLYIHKFDSDTQCIFEFFFKWRPYFLNCVPNILSFYSLSYKYTGLMLR